MGRLVSAAVILLVALLGLRVAGAPIFPWNATNPNARGSSSSPDRSSSTANNPSANGSNANSSNAIGQFFAQQTPSSAIQPVPQTRSTGFSSEVPTTAEPGQTSNPNNSGTGTGTGTSTSPQPSNPVNGRW